MSSKNPFTTRHAICDTCRKCHCCPQTPDYRPGTPYETSMPRSLSGGGRALRDFYRRRYNDKSQTSEIDQSRDLYAKRHFSRDNSPRGPREDNNQSNRVVRFPSGFQHDHQPAAPNVDSIPTSPLHTRYTFLSNDAGPEEFPLDYSEPSIISTNTAFPSILTPDISSGTPDPAELPLNLFADHRTQRSSGHVPKFRCPSPAPEDDPFYYLSARSRRQNEHGNHDPQPNNEASYQNPAQLARLQAYPYGLIPSNLHSVCSRSGREHEVPQPERASIGGRDLFNKYGALYGNESTRGTSTMRDTANSDSQGLYGEYRAAHGNGDTGGIFTMRDSAVPDSQGLYVRCRDARTGELIGERYTLRELFYGDWLGDSERRKDGEGEAEGHVIAVEYPASGSRGDPLGYYPGSGHVPRYY